MKASFFQLVTAFFMGANALFGQALDSQDLAQNLQNLSEAPLDRVVDFGEVFSVDSRSRTKLSHRLGELDERYQFSVYYIAYSGIIGSNVSEKAAEFRDLWLGAENEGLIFVCDTDMKTIAYALTKVDGLPIDGGNHTWKLPDHEVVQAMLELSSINAKDMDEEEYLSTMGHLLVDKLESRLKAQALTRRRSQRGILGTIGATAGLIGLGIWWVRRKSPAVSGESLGTLFPAIEIPNRLGAPFGGGVVSEITFQRPRSVPDS